MPNKWKIWDALLSAFILRTFVGLHCLKGTSIWHPYQEVAAFWAGQNGPTSPCHWRMLLSAGPPQTGNCPLVLCHNASLAHVPAVALTEDAPRMPHASSPSSVPTFTLVTPPHTPWGHKCCAGLPSPAGILTAATSYTQTCTPLPSGALPH